jgi:hypothetical protein
MTMTETSTLPLARSAGRPHEWLLSEQLRPNDDPAMIGWNAPIPVAMGS